MALPRHRQPRQKLSLRDALRCSIYARAFLADGLNEVEGLLSEPTEGLDGKGGEGITLLLGALLVSGGLEVLE